MRKVFLAFLLALTISLFFHGRALAAGVSCNLGSGGFNPDTGVINYCVGGFSSVADLKSHTVSFTCKSSKVAAGCGLTPAQFYNLSLVPDAAIANSPEGYWTCFSMNLNSQIATLDVAVQDSGGGVACTDFNIGTASPGSSLMCPDGNGINTAIGCIPINNQNALAGFFLRWGVGIGGGIAFLLIIVAGIQIMTSRGDPNRLKAGQELMTSAIAGLLLLIFSVIILRIIGFDILNIAAFK